MNWSDKEASMAEQQRRLYRSRTNKVLAGICGGIGEYLNIDPTIIRVMVIAMTIFGGSGILLYVVSYFIIPEPGSGYVPSVGSAHASSFALAVGVVLVGIGVLLLLDNLDFISFHRWWNIGWDVALPAVLIGAGLLLLTRKKPFKDEAAPVSAAAEGTVSDETLSLVDEGSSTPPPNPPPAGGPASAKTLRRSKTDRRLLGICGGLAVFFGLDSTIIRLMYVIFTVLSAGAGFVLYALMFFIVPEEQN
jgi:phage shock protein C